MEVYSQERRIQVGGGVHNSISSQCEMQGGRLWCAQLLACNQWQSIPHLGESITMLVVLISVNHTSCRVKRTSSTKWKPFCAQHHRTQFPLLICIEVIHFPIDEVYQ
jgi:hypothetical protein